MESKLCQQAEDIEQLKKNLSPYLSGHADGVSKETWEKLQTTVKALRWDLDILRMDQAWNRSNGAPPSHALSSSERCHRRRKYDDIRSSRRGYQKNEFYAKRTSRRNTTAEDNQRCYS